MEFVKMEGLGNDYVFVDLTKGGSDRDWPSLAREISHRHFGIGSDGLILILPPQAEGDFRMKMFNSDGSEGEMCGNGIRCFARYVYERGLTGKTQMDVETPAGVVRPEVLLEEGRVAGVRVDMGRPRMLPEEIPCTLRQTRSGLPWDVLAAAGRQLEVMAVSVGNPHAVIVVSDVGQVPLEELGAAIERHEAFPKRTNVEFVQVLNTERIRVRVWERGSGVTLACGTGASAAAVACSCIGLIGRKNLVDLPGGELEIEWAQNGHVYMTGPANEVFRGVYTREGTTPGRCCG